MHNDVIVSETPVVTVQKKGTFYLVAAVDMHSSILSVGFFHSKTQRSLFPGVISGATPNPMKETMKERVRVLFERSIICSSQASPIEEGETTQPDPYDRAYDFSSRDYMLDVVRIFLTELQLQLNIRKNDEGFTGLKEALDSGLHIMCVADINLGFPGEGPVAPFLHDPALLETLLKETLGDKISSIERVLVSATPAAVTASKALCKQGEHGHACDKGAEENRVFREVYGAMVKQINPAQQASGHEGPLTRSASKKSPRRDEERPLENGRELVKQQLFSRADDEDNDEGAASKKCRTVNAAATSERAAANDVLSMSPQTQPRVKGAGVGQVASPPSLPSSPNAGSCHCLSACCCSCCASGPDTRRVHDVSQVTRPINMRR